MCRISVRERMLSEWCFFDAGVSVSFAIRDRFIDWEVGSAKTNAQLNRI